MVLLNDEAMVTNWFGPNDNYASGYHEGLDFVPMDRTSWSLFSPITGTIMWAGWGDVYGRNFIVYDARSGLSLRFCHLDSMIHHVGRRVQRGDLLGVGGNTGRSEGRHFHMNVVPMATDGAGGYTYGVKAFGNNGYDGRVDPLGVLRALGAYI